MECNTNKDDRMDYDDECNGGLDCINKRVQKCQWKQAEVRKTADVKGRGLFAMEDIEKDEYVTEYAGKIDYKRTENN